MSIRILLADDHTIVRDGLCALLNAEPGMVVVASVADGRLAVSTARRLEPDVVVMDVNMPGLNGIEATREIVALACAPRVVMLSMHGSSEYVHRALESGASGYLLKESAGTEVIGAVRAVAAGRRYLGKQISARAMAAGVPGRRAVGPLESLSARERQLLQLLAEGRSNAEAARLLSLSIKTIETYRSRLLQKLSLNGTASLVRFALEHGLI